MTNHSGGHQEFLMGITINETKIYLESVKLTYFNSSILFPFSNWCP